jgi:hypothetical protein
VFGHHSGTWPRLAAGGAPIPAGGPRFSDHALMVVVFICACLFISSVYKNWRGQFSAADDDRRKKHEDQNWAVVGIADAYRRVARHPPPVPFTHTEREFRPQRLDVPDILAWHAQAKELYTLRKRSLRFDPEQGWQDDRRCWIGEDLLSNSIIALLCVDEYPTDASLAEFTAFGKKIAAEKPIEYHIAVKNLNSANPPTNRIVDGVEIHCETRDSLLDGLVDFSDYFNNVKERVERSRLPDSEPPIRSIYVPSRIESENRELIPETLEGYLAKWLRETGRRQLALLGEYGQGKSTGVLMFAYHLIEKGLPGGRIPLIIELRGRSPQNHTPEDLLATWAHRYDINARALMQLVIGGRVLLIFEGFDEMAHASLYEDRIEHFKVLWQFSFEQAKILFTGRSNFFLDDAEMRNALGIAPDELAGLPRLMSQGPHCEFIRLRPFTPDQIQSSLEQWAEPDVVEQIVSLARIGGQAAEIVSRPSLLYIVARLWKSQDFRSNQNGISSAQVIWSFILHSLRRQTEKSEEGPKFMFLTEAERLYFTEGVAVVMGKGGSTNQILRTQFRDTIQTLLQSFDPEISKMRTAQEKVDIRPLPQRTRDLDNPVETIETDVRAYGILISDLTRPGALQFAHKSFFELLLARVCAFKVLGDTTNYWSSLFSATGFYFHPGTVSSEVLTFFAEVLVNELRKAFGGRGDSKFGVVSAELYYRIVVNNSVTPRGRFTDLQQRIARIIRRIAVYTAFRVDRRTRTRLAMISIVLCVSGATVILEGRTGRIARLVEELAGLTWVSGDVPLIVGCLLGATGFTAYFMTFYSVIRRSELILRVRTWFRCAILAGSDEKRIRASVGKFVLERLERWADLPMVEMMYPEDIWERSRVSGVAGPRDSKGEAVGGPIADIGGQTLIGQ